MNVHFTNLAAAARDLGGEVVKGSVLCPGPGHSAKDRSLSVSFDPSAPDGFVVNSFAGDDPMMCKDHVRAKLGMPAWEPGEGAEDIIARMQATAQRHDFNDAPRQGTGPAGRVVAEYVYRLEDGTPYTKVLRFDPKEFKQQLWTGSGWAWGKPKGPKVPYRLPEMQAAIHNTVFVCEGEKDADALAALGLVATSASEGAGKWTEDLNCWFGWKTVHILADNDEQGAAHARKVAENLCSVADAVRVVNLPGLPPKGDVSDWLAAGNDPAGLVALCEAVPFYRPGEEPRGEPAGGKPPPPSSTFSADHLHSMRFPDLRFVVPGFLTEGCTVLAGAPKLGKSWLCLDIGIAVAEGGTCLGSIQCEEGEVLYLALEDNKRRLQRRMQKLMPLFQGWPKGLHFATEWPRDVQGGVQQIREWIANAKNARLVIVDVLAMFRSPRGGKESLYEADYAAVKGLQQLASETGVAIVIVHHVRKGGSDLDPFEEVSGTFGLMGAADAGLVLRRDGNGVTLYTRGRDIEEAETAVEYDREACRWRVLGAAADVRRSDERKTILNALAEADEALTPKDLMLATEMENRNALDILLFKMTKAGEVRKLGRGLYGLPGKVYPPGKNGKKERSEDDAEAYRRASQGGDDH